MPRIKGVRRRGGRGTRAKGKTAGTVPNMIKRAPFKRKKPNVLVSTALLA